MFGVRKQAGRSFASRWQKLSRWQAASLRLVVSVFIAAVVAALLIGVWYPPPYFGAGGGLRLLLLLIGTDLILGPLLTLLIFKQDKLSIKLDLAIIGLLQIIALVFGMFVIVQSRPVFIVASVDRFITVAANQLTDVDLLTARYPGWRKRSWQGPVLVATQRPENSAQRQELLFSALAGKDIELYPYYYVPYQKAVVALLERAQRLEQLRMLHPAKEQQIDEWLATHKLVDSDVRWLPLVAQDTDLVMLVRQQNGQLLGVLPLDPWLKPSASAVPSEHSRDAP